jgi:ABC-type lipoprotein release transport system permease subunit
MEFFATYDVMTGVRIAATLGAFFGLMVFLIVYKSRSTTNKALQVSDNLIFSIFQLAYYYRFLNLLSSTEMFGRSENSCSRSSRYARRGGP